jgi:hypothetical protein
MISRQMIRYAQKKHGTTKLKYGDVEFAWQNPGNG